MRTIAIEEHFLADGYREAMDRAASGGGGGMNTGSITSVQAKLRDLGEQRLRDMDAGGIDLQVISQTTLNVQSLAPGEDVPLAQAANDQLAAAIAAHPTRFAGFATLPMTNPSAAVAELRRAIRLPGFRGAMVNNTTGGRFLDDPTFLPVLEEIVALDVPLYIHPAEPPAAVREAYFSGLNPALATALATGGWGWHQEVGLHALRLIASGIFDRLPTLQIVIGHMGEMLPFMLARSTGVLAQHTRHLKHTLPEYITQNFHITTSAFFTEPPFLQALQLIGADRLIFSVDYPYSSNEQGRTFLDSLAINPTDKEKICHLNAERLLKLG
ncbi:amidohydrolase [Reticulibacter mediterranei]|uniref:Amidohydrolase n=1 Tax=Reticulibacter mediterranei TaxID=2778369 RepID=A0A8J3IPD6_9CHLR|nr:amidohydrolase family protein [Reticulibacter mediterranei]GHO98276.1 amidohydrolase [Reticulibacter mediterranei]